MLMKRMAALLLAVLMLLTFVACGEEPAGTDANSTQGRGTTTTAGEDASGEADDTTTEADGTTTKADDTTKQGETTTTKKGETTTTKKGETTKATTTKKGETTTKGRGTTTTKGGYTTESRPDVEGYVGQNVTLKEGTVSCTIDPATGKKWDFGGKTYTFASINTTEKYTNMVKAYEKEYNVKIKLDGPGFDVYLEKVASQQAANEPYDVLYMYDTWFPQEITRNLVQPIDPYITTADLWDPVKKEGFSMSQLQGLAWNNHAYCAAGAYHSGCTGIFYNKKMFKQAGQPDLLDLYYKGQLTWEKLYEIGTALNNPSKNVYFINNFSNYYNSTFCVSYGTDFVKISDGVAKENLSDKQLTAALQMFQKFTAGEGRLTDRTAKADEKDGLAAFEAGTTATVIAWPASWTHIRNAVDGKSAAFDKDIKNIGWCPLPEQNAAKTNVMGSFGGAAVGTYTEQPYVAVTLAHWNSIYNIEGAYVDGMNADIKKISCELLDKDNFRAPISGFASSAGSVQAIRENICRATANGGDIAQTLKAYKKNLQRVLDAATES